MKRFFPTLLAMMLGTMVHAQIPFATTPSWESTDLPNHSTGAAWADIDQDGWMDLVVANGNDMSRGHVVVYFNDRHGHLPGTPGWISDDVDYHGHCSVADINGDGYPEIAVSVFLGPAGFSQQGRVKLYSNTAGVISRQPAWMSEDRFYTFSLAFGDADGDGDPDLAVACGEAYNQNPERHRVYYNTDGVLGTLPGWMSAAAGYGMDVVWSDMDNDGRLDLLFACERGPNLLFHNHGDSLATVPGWVAADAGTHGNSLYAADIDSDGFPDLAVSDNNQLGGEGRFKIYRNRNGVLDASPSWRSASDGYGSGNTLVDVDNDGRLDLVAGGWWEPCRIWLNRSTGFASAPDFSTATGTVIEAIVFADVDNDGIDTLRSVFTGDGLRRLFQLPRAPLQAVIGVRVDDVPVAGAWCADRESGWVSLGHAPEAGKRVEIMALASHDLDMAYSNWDKTIGNHLYINTTTPTGVEHGAVMPPGVRIEPCAPNPFTDGTRVTVQLVEASPIQVEVYDTRGTLVRRSASVGCCQPGRHSIAIAGAGLPSGVLFCAVETAAGRAWTRLVKY